MIISPTSPCTKLVARVWNSPSAVFGRLPERDETFSKLIKKHGFEWSSDHRAWKRALDAETSGAPCDRAAEIAATLINAGYVVDVDDALAELVQRGSWSPEQKRWVKAGKDVFLLHWKGTDDNLYRRSLWLPESRWDSLNKAIAVPAMYFGEVQGFADEHDFIFTPSAQELMEQSRRDYVRVLMPEAPAPKAPRKKKSMTYELDTFRDIPAHQLALKTSLHPHQVPAVEKISPMKVGALFMDMGTGKTRCAIELVHRRQARISKVIWFTPVSLKLTVQEEIEKHTWGETVHVFDERTSADNLPNAFWYVVGLESISASDRVVLAVDKLVDADTFVIVDESSYIKGHASKRSMRMAELGKQARYRLLLTGTPITQGVEDLYAQMRFLSPDILGYNSFYSFANNHLEYSEKYPGMIVRSLQVDRLAEKIAPFVYQITKEECLTLPPKLYDSVYFGLGKEQAEAYEQAKMEILSEALDTSELDSWIIFKLFTALQQIVSGFWNRNGEMLRFPHKRVETLRTVLDGLPQGEKVIIWCKYIESVKQIAEAMPGCALYYGDLDEKERAGELAKWRAEGCQYLVATQATGGHGLTLNEAHLHVFYENEFKYSHRIQAEDRSHRIGQENPVTYIDIAASAGIDRRILAALSKKEDVVKAFKREVNKTNQIDL